MSIKSGQILFSADNGFIIDRIQTGGINNLNIPLDRVYELGNYQSVGVVRDIPDLSFQVETMDVTAELEGLILGGPNPVDLDSATPSVTYYDYNANLPIDIISPFRSAFNAYDIINGIAIPQLYLDSIGYRFAVRQNSSETWTLRGDSVFYIPGSPYTEQFVAPGASAVFAASHAALPFAEKGVTKFALNVSVNGVRKFLGPDYTETNTPLTVTFVTPPNAGDIVRITYGSSVANTSFPTTAGSPAPLAIKPAAVRGRDIDVYVQVPGSTPDMVRWDGVQSANVNWSVNLQADEEFGNYHYVTEDYVTAMVRGDVTVLPKSTANLFAKIEQITNVPAGQIAGALTSTPLGMEIRVSTPDTGVLIKTLYCPDARFTPPAVSSRVNQKLTAAFNWESDTGLLYCYPGPNAPVQGSTVGGGEFTV